MRSRVFLGLLASLLLARAANAQTVPTNFTPLEQNGVVLTDPIGDVATGHAGLDARGCDANPPVTTPPTATCTPDQDAAFVQANSFNGTEYLWFRIRVNANPAAFNNGWGCQIDMNGNDHNFEYTVILSNKNANIATFRNTGRTDSPNDGGYVFITSEALSNSNHQFSLAPGGNGYFVDFGVPITDLNSTQFGQVTGTTPLRFVCGTNSDGNTPRLTNGGSADVINSPAAGDLWHEVRTDVYYCPPTGCYRACSADQDCPMALPVCDTGTGICGQCTVSENPCPVETPFCVNDTCVQCEMDSDCSSASAAKCDQTSHTCVPCTANANCTHLDPLDACVSGTCDQCGNGINCPDGQFCSPSNTCVACLANFGTGMTGACTNATMPFCDSDNTCKACNATLLTPQTCGTAPGSTNRPICDTLDALTGACVQCDSGDKTGCVGNTPICDLQANGGNDRCVGCDATNTGDDTCMDVNPTHPACLGADDQGGHTKGQCVQCIDDSTCSDGTPKCDTTVSLCVPCLTSADCMDASKPVCITDMGSPDFQTCQPCNNPDADPDFCAMTGDVCNPDSGKCVECLTDGNCPNTMGDPRPICSAAFSCEKCTDALSATACADFYTSDPACAMTDATGISMGECVQCTTTSDKACTDAGQVCDGDVDLCVACTKNGDCGADSATPECHTNANPLLNACGACTTDAPCTDTKLPVCFLLESSANDGRCEECSAAETKFCTDQMLVCDASNPMPATTPLGKCVVCNVDADCSKTPATPLCNPHGGPNSTPACVPRCTDEMCLATPATPVCNPVTGLCDQCSATEPGACPAMHDVCVNGVCGCTKKSDCTDPAKPECDPTLPPAGQCVQCLTNVDCVDVPNKPFCDTNKNDTTYETCVANCPNDAACPGDRPVCNTIGEFTGQCTECAEGKTDLCTSRHEVCDTLNEVCVQCVLGTDCPSGVCLTNHTCEGVMPDAPPPPDAPPVVVPDATPGTPDARPVIPDARPVVPDARPPTPDAPPAPPDAKIAFDAKPATDANTGPVVTPDKGVVEGGGLSCSVGGHDAPAGALWTLLIGAAVLLGGRRRRSR
jgi:MYXO-CTERM domain-containing protein